MLAFLTAVRSKATCRSWERMSEVFGRTMRSVSAQSTAQFRSIVVCHEIPLEAPRQPNVEYLTVDFPPPGDEWIDREYDKAKKLFTGFLYAARIPEVTHVMFVDSDDCIHNSIAQFVNARPGADGWYLADGYRHVEGSDRVTLLKGRFHLICGTSHI